MVRPCRVISGCCESVHLKLHLLLITSIEDTVVRKEVANGLEKHYRYIDCHICKHPLKNELDYHHQICYIGHVFEGGGYQEI